MPNENETIAPHIALSYGALLARADEERAQAKGRNGQAKGFLGAAMTSLLRVIIEDAGGSEAAMTATDKAYRGVVAVACDDALAAVEAAHNVAFPVESDDSKKMLNRRRKQHSDCKLRVVRVLADCRLQADSGKKAIDAFADGESVDKYYRTVTKVAKPSKEDKAKADKARDEALRADGVMEGMENAVTLFIDVTIANLTREVAAMASEDFAKVANGFAALYAAIGQRVKEEKAAVALAKAA